MMDFHVNATNLRVFEGVDYSLEKTHKEALEVVEQTMLQSAIAERNAKRKVRPISKIDDNRGKGTYPSCKKAQISQTNEAASFRTY